MMADTPMEIALDRVGLDLVGIPADFGSKVGLSQGQLIANAGHSAYSILSSPATARAIGRMT